MDRRDFVKVLAAASFPGDSLKSIADLSDIASAAAIRDTSTYLHIAETMHHAYSTRSWARA
jgi:hypothetical protein